MPQMAPLNWLSLMIVFVIILVMFNITNYFSFTYQIKQKKTEIQDKKTNWKW